MLIIHLIEVS